MVSSLSNSHLIEEVRNFLTNAIPNAIFSETVVDSLYKPLLLMQSQHSVAAFAFANGQTDKSYEILYRGFKELYSTQKGNWDAFDLSFVFCIQPDTPQIELFCSKVETDVYFCRKFVIQLSIPLSSSFSPLPFIPLSPLPGQSLRPPSAQSFLQQRGVNSELTYFLVKPQQRSEKGIVDDCISNRFGEPQPLGHTTTGIVAPDEGKVDSVCLDTVEIENFRAYRKSQSFKIGKDITVLFGPNGFGKTSFFDAIDFAITGGIGRLEPQRHTKFSMIAKHLDANQEEPMVSIKFSSKDTVHEIIRSVKDRNHPILDGKPTSRKSILSKLTLGGQTAGERVDHLVRLFRASHLFSQEQQELTKDFRSDCQLSAEIVSRMLAFEDYVNAIKKVTKVRGVLSRIIDSSNKEVETNMKQNAIDKKELDRLNKNADELIDVPTLDSEIDSLREKLIAVGIEVSPDKPDKKVLRGWRATIESRLSHSVSFCERLNNLKKDVSVIPRYRAELTTLEQEIDKQEEAHRTKEEKLKVVKQSLMIIDQSLAKITAKREELYDRTNSINWVRNNQSRYTHLVQRHHQINEKSKRYAEEIGQIQENEARNKANLHSLEVTAKQLSEKLMNLHVQLDEASTLDKLVPIWQTNRTKRAAIVKSIEELKNSLVSLNAEKQKAEQQLVSERSKEQKLVQQIDVVDKTQSEIRKLVSQLQTHVRTGICPVCGDDHGSKNQLIRRIQKHVDMDGASEARVELTTIRKKTESLVEIIDANSHKQENINEQINNMNRERAEIEAEITIFTTLASKYAIALEADSSNVSQQVELITNRLRADVMQIEKESQEIETPLESARMAVTTATNKLRDKISEADENKKALARTLDEINQLRGSTPPSQINLDTNPNILFEIEAAIKKDFEVLEIELQKVSKQASQKKTEIAIIRQELKTLKTKKESSRNHRNKLQEAISLINVRLEEENLPTNSNEESLAEIVTTESRLQTQLRKLQDKAYSLELALDSATTAAVLSTLQQTIQKRESTISKANTKADQHKPWLKYFEQISKILLSQQNDTIDSFTRQYGPRTSVIQRRLRSVYGFDDIKIKGQESSINVRVMRKGQELRPVDYFSQSQQQTLLLGLFLTASTSQTWSLFAPVFLDDPVTHFDDLNTYALLDLILGLINSTEVKRQFVISTCDEKLLQLSRQKFRHLGQRAKF